MNGEGGNSKDNSASLLQVSKTADLIVLDSSTD